MTVRATYSGDPGRYYPSLALHPEPGEAYELEQVPDDGRWTADTPTTKSPAVAKEKDDAEPID